MLSSTNYTVSSELLQESLARLPDIHSRYALNVPVDDFFYGPWKLKEEFIGTVWEQIYDSLPVSNKGEARLIKLTSGSCYTVHADMDDRYHLNLTGNNCYLIDFDTNTLLPITADGIWYNMNAGVKHVAANFGSRTRYQLVVRQLLNPAALTCPISVSVTSTIDLEDARFLFDNTISPWLNKANKQGLINNFRFTDHVAEFDIEKDALDDLLTVVPTELPLTIK